MDKQHPITVSLLAGALLLLSGCAAATGPAPADPTSEAHPLEGTWTISWTTEELYEALGGDDNPYARADAEANSGPLELVIEEEGSYDFRYPEDDSSCPGTYELDGDRIVMTATTDPSLWDCGDGVGQLVLDAAWSVDGDKLVLSDWNLSPEPSMDWFYEAVLGRAPLTRAG